MAGEAKTLTVGQNATSLDIFLTANGAAVSGQYVGFEIFDAANVSTVSGIALNPALGNYTASGVIPANFQLGTWRIDWDIITAGNSYVTASEEFCVQDINVTIGFQPSEDKTSSIYEAVRIDIGDPDAIVFSDNFLARVLTKAVRRLNQRLGLSATSRPKGIPGGFGGPRIKVSPITADLSSGTINPDNDEICDLVVLMMEYIIVTSETTALKRLSATASSGPYAGWTNLASKDGVSVTNADGVTVSISPSRLSNRVALQKLDVETRKEELEMSIRAFLNRMTGNFGKMIY